METEIIKCERCMEVEVKVMYRDGEYPSWEILCEGCKKKESEERKQLWRKLQKAE